MGDLQSCRQQVPHTKSNDAIHFKMITCPEDFDNPNIVFKPTMSYQVFKGENISGYAELNIEIMFMASTLKSYVTSNYSRCNESSASSSKNEISAKLSEWMSIDYENNLDEFKELLETEHTFRPAGVVIDQFKVLFRGHERVYHTYYCAIEDEQYCDFHKRLESFIVFFIAGASKIVLDERWYSFTTYEVVHKDEKTFYRVAGYATIYKFFAFPDKFRPRISQFLILPIYQRQGLGKRLLHAIYKIFSNDPSVVEITVEDPCIEYQNLRDVVETSLALQLPCCSRQGVKRGFTPMLSKQIRDALRLPTGRVRRIYELARMFWIQNGDPEDVDRLTQEIMQRHIICSSRTQASMSRTLERCNLYFGLLPNQQAQCVVAEDLEDVLTEYQCLTHRIIRSLAKRNIIDLTPTVKCPPSDTKETEKVSSASPPTPPPSIRNKRKASQELSPE